MSDLFYLTDTQMEKIEQYFPKSRGIPRVDDRMVLSGIIHVLKNGLKWSHLPEGYGSHKTVYNRFVRWSEAGIFVNILEGLAGTFQPGEQAMIDATFLKVHRTAASLKKGDQKAGRSGEPKAV